MTTDSWRDRSGALYQPNTLVYLDLPSLKIGGPASQTNNLGAAAQIWLISEVTYRRDSQRGTTADLVIMPQAAFLPEPVVFQPLALDVAEAFSQLFPGDGR